MPTEVVALLAHMSVARAVSLALLLFGSSAAVWFLAIDLNYAAAARTTKAAVCEAWTQIALTLAALLILTIPTGGNR